MTHVSRVSVDVRALPEPTDGRSCEPRRGAILIVEDCDDVREGLAQLLELNGFVVCDAANGVKALTALHGDPDAFALILLDLRLPGGLSGEDVRVRQLEDPVLAEIPTIVISASEAHRGGSERLRPAAWLEKPFRCEVLLAAVRRFVAPEPDTWPSDPASIG